MTRIPDDDLYGGYDDDSVQVSGGGAVFQAVGDASAGGQHPPGTAMRSYVPLRTAQRMATAMGGTEQARPMTSNVGAGFSSVPNKKFDPLSQVREKAGAANALLKKHEASPEERLKEIEVKVHELLEQSALALHKGDSSRGLDLAAEARKAEKTLNTYRDTYNLGDGPNPELTFAVEFNLANMYHVNKNFKEALDMYTDLARNKTYGQGWRVRINMGNAHFEQKKYSTAIKMYRMALDQVPPTSKEVRFKVMRNIGLAFVRMGNYQDALQAFAQVMEQSPDHQTGYNLIVCTYALGDREAMKEAFSRLLTVKSLEDEEEEGGLAGLISRQEEEEMGHVVQDDALKYELRKRQASITRCIVSAAQLISEKIDRQGGFQAGYDWCIEQLRQAGLTRLANEVELAKASKFLANKEFEGAINVFKEFEKKEPRVKARAATNLSFLYILEGELDKADRYAELAMKSDRYNARAFVNKGCVLVESGDPEAALELFSRAIRDEPYCVEALYNQGLVHMKLGNSMDAIRAFEKLHTMLPNNYEVMWQLAACHDMQGNTSEAIQWLTMLSTHTPDDPGVWSRLGAIYSRLDDEGMALRSYQEAHRVYPVNMDVISWLGAYHVKHEVYEKAMPFFDLASKVQPQEVKWALMVASCYRRIGAFPQALAKYKEIHASHPNNVECLRYLVHLCTELKRRDDAQKYMTELRKAEVAAAAETKAVVPGTQRPGSAMGGVAPGQLQAGGGGGGFTVPSDELSAGLNVPVARGKKVVAKEDGANDDWGNEELGDDLLPM